MSQNLTDERWMRVALGLARRGLGNVWPNPSVGCVIIKDGVLVGQGWTQKGGRPHAETVALAMAGEAARGATAYVTLEPCAHHGKTPPCASALAKAGIVRVVCALDDPDPRVSGEGFAMLRAAGVKVKTDILMDEATEINLGFLYTQTIGRPMFTLKMASSLDGKITSSTGRSRWITGEEARLRVHLLRARHDAILVGANTARLDDPLLDVREAGLEAESPVRVVLDGGLSIPLTSRLARTASKIPLWICHHEGLDRSRKEAWAETGARLVELRRTPQGELDLNDLAGTLAKAGITRVLCEGGGRLAASLLRAELVDRLVLFTAGMALGGDGKSLFGALGIDDLADAPRFKLTETTRCGDDLMTVWNAISK